MTDGPYRDLGKLLTGMALKRLACAPHTIVERVGEVSDLELDPGEVLEYLEGTRCPTPMFIPAFAEAFSLTPEERRRLAWMYTFSELPR